ncbi:hypothetical protein HOY34_00475 [Xinfangfangia sp. D13-10-4-6]|uniref:DUF1127 domain-containing protein n=1 Tax=Pseudogemmobacter hezensis TaxID=2737662 RepID=UPI001551C2D8|nr:hypothetical protein [Pseudogemmobacter hezensis]NPD13674.1 hypothetical protein [Pseudogemmobacter hezensis]
MFTRSALFPARLWHGLRRQLSLRRLAAKFSMLIALQRSRKKLRRLSDDSLHDIGLSREIAEAEAARQIWDPPAHWRQS